MTKHQVQQILANRAVPHPTVELQLVETHISWVFLADAFAYKIKKPLKLSFLDFSTAQKRARCCEQEVRLNRRLAPEMYLGVLPVTLDSGTISIGGREGEVVDYAVWMQRMDDSRQMDLLLEKGDVDVASLDDLAEILARFHKGTRKIREAETWKELYEEFADISGQGPFLDQMHESGTAVLVDGVVRWVFDFLKGNAERIEARKEAGFVVDGHGDLHCRNIFLLQPPVIFDCIEFSESLRTLDVLNEVAFLCMDLERFGREDLANRFLERYLHLTGAMENEADRSLFLYYKLYRANVRIKVLCIQLGEGGGTEGAAAGGNELLGRYLGLFRRYYRELKGAWNPL
jgi:aminoglycoside phosphotransferase family enzyme